MNSGSDTTQSANPSADLSTHESAINEYHTLLDKYNLLQVKAQLLQDTVDDVNDSMHHMRKDAKKARIDLETEQKAHQRSQAIVERCQNLFGETLTMTQAAKSAATAKGRSADGDSGNVHFTSADLDSS